jgi:hypothetical protein
VNNTSKAWSAKIGGRRSHGPNRATSNTTVVAEMAICQCDAPSDTQTNQLVKFLGRCPYRMDNQFILTWIDRREGRHPAHGSRVLETSLVTSSSSPTPRSRFNKPRFVPATTTPHQQHFNPLRGPKWTHRPKLRDRMYPTINLVPCDSCPTPPPRLP